MHSPRKRMCQSLCGLRPRLERRKLAEKSTWATLLCIAIVFSLITTTASQVVAYGEEGFACSGCLVNPDGSPMRIRAMFLEKVGVVANQAARESSARQGVAYTCDDPLSSPAECFQGRYWNQGWVGALFADIVANTGGEVVAMTPANFSRASAGNSDASEVTRCAREVQLGLVDVCVADGMETEARRQLAAFTSALEVDVLRVLTTPASDPAFEWKDFLFIFDPFHFITWIMIFVMIMTGGFIAFVLDGAGQRQDVFPPNQPTCFELTGAALSSLSVWIWRAAVFDFRPKGKVLWGTRLVVLGYSFFVIITISFYVASLAAILSRERVAHGRISSLEDVITAGGSVCSVEQDAELLRSLGVAVQEFDAYGPALEKLNRKECMAAVIGSEAFRTYVESSTAAYTVCDDSRDTKGNSQCQDSTIPPSTIRLDSCECSDSSKDPSDCLDECPNFRKFCHLVPIWESGLEAGVSIAWPVAQWLQDPLSAWIVKSRQNGRVEDFRRTYLDLDAPPKSCPRSKDEVGDGVPTSSLSGAFLIGGGIVVLGLLWQVLDWTVCRRLSPKELQHKGEFGEMSVMSGPDDEGGGGTILGEAGEGKGLVEKVRTAVALEMSRQEDRLVRQEERIVRQDKKLDELKELLLDLSARGVNVEPARPRGLSAEFDPRAAGVGHRGGQLESEQELANQRLGAARVVHEDGREELGQYIRRLEQEWAKVALMHESSSKKMEQVLQAGTRINAVDDLLQRTVAKVDITNSKVDSMLELSLKHDSLAAIQTKMDAATQSIAIVNSRVASIMDVSSKMDRFLEVGHQVVEANEKLQSTNTRIDSTNEKISSFVEIGVRTDRQAEVSDKLEGVRNSLAVVSSKVESIMDISLKMDRFLDVTTRSSTAVDSTNAKLGTAATKIEDVGVKVDRLLAMSEKIEIISSKISETNVQLESGNERVESLGRIVEGKVQSIFALYKVSDTNAQVGAVNEKMDALGRTLESAVQSVMSQHKIAETNAQVRTVSEKMDSLGQMVENAVQSVMSKHKITDTNAHVEAANGKMDSLGQTLLSAIQSVMKRVAETSSQVADVNVKTDSLAQTFESRFSSVLSQSKMAETYDRVESVVAKLNAMEQTLEGRMQNILQGKLDMTNAHLEAASFDIKTILDENLRRDMNNVATVAKIDTISEVGAQVSRIMEISAKNQAILLANSNKTESLLSLTSQLHQLDRVSELAANLNSVARMTDRISSQLEVGHWTEQLLEIRARMDRVLDFRGRLEALGDLKEKLQSLGNIENKLDTILDLNLQRKFDEVIPGPLLSQEARDLSPRRIALGMTGTASTVSPSMERLGSTDPRLSPLTTSPLRRDRFDVSNGSLLEHERVLAGREPEPQAWSSPRRHAPEFNSGQPKVDHLLSLSPRYPTSGEEAARAKAGFYDPSSRTSEFEIHVLSGDPDLPENMGITAQVGIFSDQQRSRQFQGGGIGKDARSAFRPTVPPRPSQRAWTSDAPSRTMEESGRSDQSHDGGGRTYY